MTLLQAARITRKLGAESAIRFLLGRVHVGTPAETVRADFERRVRNGKATGPDAIALGTETCVEAITTYALALHRHNGRTYRRVMRGSL